MAVHLDRPTLEAALVGYQRQLEEIESKISELRRRLGNSPGSNARPAAAPAAAGRRRRKHRMSPEGRARIAAAQRARWARFKKAAK